MHRNCLERLRLGKALAAAADAVDGAKRELESAKVEKAETTDLEDLAHLLKGARSKAREAQRLFDHHVAMHHCQP